MRPIQYFSEEYLRQCARMSPDQVLAFLEEFRLLHGAPRKSRSRLISLKVDESLLGAFRAQCGLRGIPYQTHIKRLMRAWLDRPDRPSSPAL